MEKTLGDKEFDGKYFKWSELTRSATADRLHIDNQPKDPEVKENLQYMISRLDEIREGYGKPICVNSGYRCPALNSAVGGVKDSYHQSGLAVDLRWDSELMRYIVNNCRFDKLIRERSKTAIWLHLQFRKNIKEERNRIVYLNTQ